MAVETQGLTRSSFDLKSAQLSVMAVALRATQISVLATDLAQRLVDDPDFFDNDPVLIDLQHVRESTDAIDFPKLIRLLKRHRTLPVGVCNGSEAQMAAAREAGLMHAPDANTTRAKDVVREIEVIREVPVPAPNAMIIDKPLRSGQQVYAKGCDLVVMAVVSYGAEVIADGNVHIYAPLRGRAVAGARGNTQARIFSTCMEPQLLSIAGNYRALESDLPSNVAGKPAQARLDGEKLVIEPMRLA